MNSFSNWGGFVPETGVRKATDGTTSGANRKVSSMTLAAVPPTHGNGAQSVVREGSLGKITTRPSVAEDSAFMLELYASTSKDVLDDLGWTIGSQRTFVIMQAQTEEWNRARLYPGMDRLTICVDDMPVGRLLVCMRNNVLHLVDLSLLPRFRGNGIGTQLLSEILEEARNARVPVKVKIRKDSGAIRFVERLDFGTPTDLGSNVELTWMPPLTAVGPDAREDGFSSVGTRAHRPAQRQIRPAGGQCECGFVRRAICIHRAAKRNIRIGRGRIRINGDIPTQGDRAAP